MFTKTLNFFHTASDTSVSQLLEQLNAPFDRDQKYDLLISYIQSHNEGLLNQPIAVIDHTTVAKEGNTPPCWATFATQRTYGEVHSSTRDEPITTTLANIIATNELNFSSIQMATLFRALIAKHVNFVSLDESPYLDLILPKSGNNPLKSLIASSFNDPVLIGLLHDFVAYLEHHIAQEERLLIINNQDNFAYESMLPAEFLLRLGHEDLALRLYQLGAQKTPLGFQLACSSYGTTPHFEEAAQCIQLLINTPDLEEMVIDESRASLNKASPAQYDDMLRRVLQLLQEESKYNGEHSSLFDLIKDEYREHYQEKLSLSFCDFCQTKAHMDHPLIQKYALFRIKQESIGNGLFSIYYRTTELQSLAETKYHLLQHNQRANALLLQCIQLIDNRPKEMDFEKTPRAG